MEDQYHSEDHYTRSEGQDQYHGRSVLSHSTLTSTHGSHSSSLLMPPDQLDFEQNHNHPNHCQSHNKITLLRRLRNEISMMSSCHTIGYSCCCCPCRCCSRCIQKMMCLGGRNRNNFNNGCNNNSHFVADRFDQQQQSNFNLSLPPPQQDFNNLQKNQNNVNGPNQGQQYVHQNFECHPQVAQSSPKLWKRGLFHLGTNLKNTLPTTVSADQSPAESFVNNNDYGGRPDFDHMMSRSLGSVGELDDDFVTGNGRNFNTGTDQEFDDIVVFDYQKFVDDNCGYPNRLSNGAASEDLNLNASGMIQNSENHLGNSNLDKSCNDDADFEHHRSASEVLIDYGNDDDSDENLNHERNFNNGASNRLNFCNFNDIINTFNSSDSKADETTTMSGVTSTSYSSHSTSYNNLNNSNQNLNLKLHKGPGSPWVGDSSWASEIRRV